MFTNTEPVEESRHLRVNSFNEIYVFLFEIEGLFYAVTIAIAHYYAPSCKVAFDTVSLNFFTDGVTFDERHLPEACV